MRRSLSPPAGLLLNETLESTATQHILAALTPGHTYNISLAAEAGGLRSPAYLEEQTCEEGGGRSDWSGGKSSGRKFHSDASICRTAAPAAAANITCRPDGAALLVSWRRPDGDLDSVVVSVSGNDTSLWTATVAPDATNVSLGQLTPGTAYLVLVQSRSGRLTNQSEASIRTGGFFSLPPLVSLDVFH